VIQLFWRANDPSNRIYTSAAPGGLRGAGVTINDEDSTLQGVAACLFLPNPAAALAIYVFSIASDGTGIIKYTAQPLIPM
jgi:hypothetical protein